MDPQIIIKKIRPVLKKHGVLKADLFGSAIRGDMKADSDVDVLVKMPDKATLFGVGRLKIDLEQILSKNVDVVEYEAVHPYVRDSIYASILPISL